MRDKKSQSEYSKRIFACTESAEVTCFCPGKKQMMKKELVIECDKAETQVMLDYDLAEIYGCEVKRLNEQVKRNIARFPKDFMFQLTTEEDGFLKSQIATSSWGWKKKASVCIHGARHLYACYCSERRACRTAKHFYHACVS